MGQEGREIVDGDDEQGGGADRQQDEKSIQKIPALFKIAGDQKVEINIYRQGLNQDVHEVFDGEGKVEQVMRRFDGVADRDHPCQIVVDEPKRKVIELIADKPVAGIVTDGHLTKVDQFPGIFSAAI